MEWTLIQANYRCHCGQGIYLGYRFYPQPFFLLQLAGKLRREGCEVDVIDLFHNPAQPIPYMAQHLVYNIGEYTADAQYSRLPLNTNSKLSGSYIWLHRSEYCQDRIIEPNAVFGEEPTWDLINFNDYPKPDGRTRAVIRLSLGCPNHCTFCPVSIIHKGKYRRLDFDWASRQLMTLCWDRGVQEVSIIDDNLFADIELGKKLLRFIISKIPSRVRFFLQEGLEVKAALDEELCLLLKKSNFYDIRLGVETLNPIVLREINKMHQDYSQAFEAVRTLQKSGFKHPVVFLIRGLPGNTPVKEEADEQLFTRMGCKIRAQSLKHYNVC